VVKCCEGSQHIELCTVTASLPPNMTMLDPGGTVTIGACYSCLHVVDGLGACSPSIWCARQATLHICFFVCHMSGWHTVLSADLMMTTVLAASRCRCVFSQSCSLSPSVTRFMRSGRSSKTTTGQQSVRASLIGVQNGLDWGKPAAPAQRMRRHNSTAWDDGEAFHSSSSRDKLQANDSH
jgi:hypothetical protein